MSLESSLLTERNLRKDLQERFIELETTFGEIPRKKFKLDDPNFMFLYQLITKDDPIIKRNTNVIKTLEFLGTSMRNCEEKCTQEVERLRKYLNGLEIELRVEKNKNSDLGQKMKVLTAKKHSKFARNSIPESQWELGENDMSTGQQILIQNSEPWAGRNQLFAKSKFVAQTEEYETEVFQNIERGSLPKHLYCKYVIKKSLKELINKPVSQKNDIEQRLDDIFLKYIPKGLFTESESFGDGDGEPKVGIVGDGIGSSDAVKRNLRIIQEEERSMEASKRRVVRINPIVGIGFEGNGNGN